MAIIAIQQQSAAIIVENLQATRETSNGSAAAVMKTKQKRGKQTFQVANFFDDVSTKEEPANRPEEATYNVIVKQIEELKAERGIHLTNDSGV